MTAERQDEPVGVGRLLGGVGRTDLQAGQPAPPSSGVLDGATGSDHAGTGRPAGADGPVVSSSTRWALSVVAFFVACDVILSVLIAAGALGVRP